MNATQDGILDRIGVALSADDREYLSRFQVHSRSLENGLDAMGVKLSRDQRKAVRTFDFSDGTPAQLAAIRARTMSKIAHENAAFAKGGYPESTHRRNLATHLLTIECLDDLA